MKIELLQPAKDLLISSSKDLIEKLNENNEASYVKQKAFQYLLDNGEKVQVQVMVTREEDDFLDDFVTEEMTNINIKK